MKKIFDSKGERVYPRVALAIMILLAIAGVVAGLAIADVLMRSGVQP